MKATWCQIEDEPKEIFKQPKTDSGMKNSLKGLIQVLKDENGEYYAKDCVSLEEEQAGELKTIFKDGKIVKEYTFEEIRNNLKQY
jgi:nicotinamide phosphoribosyltransferase